MILIVASLLIQLACAVHIVRNGRNWLWLLVVFFFSVPGCLVYFILEVLPSQRNNRAVRAAGQVIARKVDPERDIRAARDRLEVADTVANHIELGRALAEAERHGEAVRHFEIAVERQAVPDRKDLAKLANALLEDGQARRALAVMERMPAEGMGAFRDEEEYLRARVLDGCGLKEEALAIYRDVTDRLAGEEALCRYAALCLELGHRGEARSALEKVAFKTRRLGRIERATNADMYDWADRTLAELRA